MSKIFVFVLLSLLSYGAFAKTYKYKAEMECNHCANQIKAACEKIRKLDSYKADPEKDTIEISFKDDKGKLSEKDLKAIAWESGYQLTLQED